MEWDYYVPVHLLETLHRLKLMSSPSLSDLGRSERSALDDRNNQQQRAGNNTTWISIHNAVISVFQRRDLGENELYVLNEGVRQLLKTELGSFFTEYLQNQLLTKGMVILRDKIRFYEGQKLLDSLAETWDFFFCDVLSTLQAIFHPVQGKEPSVRQLALLHFRNIITLNTKLEEALSRQRARVPPSIIQMLLILQGVHEAKGVCSDYLKLESLVQMVVSPYLGTHGLFSSDGSIMQSSCVLEKRLLRRWPRSDSPLKNLVVRSKSYNIPVLTPVCEHEPEPGGVRRHSVCQMTSFEEEPVFTEAPPSPIMNVCEDPPIIPELCSAGEPERASSSSSPETVVDQLLQSVDSDTDTEGIFIDFSRQQSSSPEVSRESESLA
ncbi:proline-rich protein 5 isoform X1 [Rhinichthys klamathensis goyatoka]|uniref:proline-rich protein 5 isoform X1 n=2 Tax=Rhinichthys klamathensis goyatoka TaxID=3034132 RepID=UPI0024B56308|nr:proline-rich protein 5 isoform X1 [Rhinichthys klamathensis goyatoka]